jgi:hypothetical protein
MGANRRSGGNDTMPVHHVRIRKNIIEGVDDICRLNSGRIKSVGEFFNIDKLDLDL